MFGRIGVIHNLRALSGKIGKKELNQKGIRFMAWEVGLTDCTDDTDKMKTKTEKTLW